MDQEIKDIKLEMPSPTLTLDPAGSESAPLAEALKEDKPEEVMMVDESNLSPQEREMVENFANQIELSSSNVILQYGAGAQKKIADFSESALGNIKSKDLGEVGDMLTSVVMELKNFEVDEEEKGIRGFFRKSANKLEVMKAKHAKAEANINQIVGVLEKHQIQLMKDVAMLDKMYDINLSYLKELTMYILAGKKKLQHTLSAELPELEEKARKSGLPEDAQAARDLSEMCNRFDKKLYDLELTKTISIQMAPQIRMIQSNDTQMSEKIQSTLVNTIPLWKSQMVLALGATHSGQAAKAQREVTDMTNELLRKNAAALKTATIDTAREAERGIVEIDTLKATNESLISTLDEVMKIQTEGRQKRREAEVELNRIEGELKQKLLQASNSR